MQTAANVQSSRGRSSFSSIAKSLRSALSFAWSVHVEAQAARLEAMRRCQW
jgi:hypothetical protein